ncbi:MAG: tetratricopeptide repeat protein, partial [Alphaproteobacteria bacterium]
DKSQKEAAAPVEEPAAAASEPAPAAEAESGEEIDYVTQPAAEEEAIDSPNIEWDVAEDLAADEADDTSLKLEEFNEGVADQTVREASEVTISMANAVKSELLFQQGEEALRNSDFVGARDLFAQAMALNPKEAEYFAYLGWTTFQERPEDPEAIQKGRDLLEQAVSINPGLDSAYMFLGLLELNEGHKDRAREFFEKAVQYNPENTRAQAELKKLEVG